ncbi:MAG: hypothetical protein QQN63_01975 [Nitrosopumilus sp.]
MEQLEKYTDRIKFLKDWSQALRMKAGDAHNLTGFQLLDQVYQNEVEIDQKQHFIESYTKHQEQSAKGKQLLTDHVDGDMSTVIKDLRTAIVDINDSSMKKGILDRFKTKSYTGNQKLQDYQNAVLLLKGLEVAI